MDRARRLTFETLLLLIGLAPAAAPALAADSRSGLAGDLARLRDVRIGAPVTLPAGELVVGRAVIKSASADRVRALIAGERTVGLLIEGRPLLTYRVEDAFSIPIAKRNLRAATGLTPRLDGTTLKFEKALTAAAVWGVDLLPGAPAPTAAAESSALPGWLLELLAGKTSDNPERDLLLSTTQGDSAYRWAVFHAAGDDYVLDVDPHPAIREESFGRFERVDGDSKVYGGRMSTSILVGQPIGATWWDARPLDFATVATDIDLVNPRGTDVTMTSRITVQALRDGLRILPFSLRSKFEDTDRKVRELRVTALLVDDAPADYFHHEGTLLVALPRTLRKDERVTFEVRTAGDILDRPEGNSYWILRTESWYPKPLASGTEHSTFKMRIEVPDPFVPFASGEVVLREKTATGTRVTTTIGVPSERAVAIAGRYTTFDREYQGARVHVSTYASAKKFEAERLADIVLGVRTCLEAWLGVPFPYQDLQLVEIQDWGWGQAPPGVIFITREAFMTPARAQSLDEPRYAAWYTRGVNERIAHEVAHSWFPHVAKVRRAEENWLSESFAEYSSIECLRQSMTDRKQGEYFFQRAVKDWKFATKEIGDGGSIYLATHLSGDREKDFHAWRALLYSKGPLVIHALRDELIREMGAERGNAAFLTWMRSYVKNFAFKTGETRHLVGILNQMTGKDWQPWFERYVYGTEMPDVK
ncbi:MAG: M1 family aminopeptidase [Thermoanaerobaculia bacterium]